MSFTTTSLRMSVPPLVKLWIKMHLVGIPGSVVVVAVVLVVLVVFVVAVLLVAVVVVAVVLVVVVADTRSLNALSSQSGTLTLPSASHDTPVASRKVSSTPLSPAQLLDSRWPSSPQYRLFAFWWLALRWFNALLQLVLLPVVIFEYKQLVLLPAIIFE